jgi:hypothetical protein
MKHINLLCILVCVTLLGCESKYVGEAMMAVDTVILSDASVDSRGLSLDNDEIIPQNANNQPLVDKKIIKNGAIDIQTENVQKARNTIETLLKSNNTYIQDENYQNSDYNESIDMTIRVPNQNFDAFVTALTNNGIGKVTRKNISVQDVTETYTDVSIRLKNKQLYLEKYREFLRTAKTTADMLVVQEKIRNMEEEIESAEGKLRYIDDRVNYSTLTLLLYKLNPPRELQSDKNFFSRLCNSLLNGWDLLVSIVIGIVTVWPLCVVAFVIIWFIRKKHKKRKSRKLLTND